MGQKFAKSCLRSLRMPPKDIFMFLLHFLFYFSGFAFSEKKTAIYILYDPLTFAQENLILYCLKTCINETDIFLSLALIKRILNSTPKMWSNGIVLTYSRVKKCCEINFR